VRAPLQLDHRVTAKPKTYSAAGAAYVARFCLTTSESRAAARIYSGALDTDVIGWLPSHSHHYSRVK